MGRDSTSALKGPSTASWRKARMSNADSLHLETRGTIGVPFAQSCSSPSLNLSHTINSGPPHKSVIASMSAAGGCTLKPVRQAQPARLDKPAIGARVTLGRGFLEPRSPARPARWQSPRCGPTATSAVGSAPGAAALPRSIGHDGTPDWRRQRRRSAMRSKSSTAQEHRRFVGRSAD